MKWMGLIIGASLMLVVCSLVLNRKTEIGFESLQEAKNRLGASGFHCIADRPDGKCAIGFLVSRTPGRSEDVNNFCKTRLGPEWKGKVWISLNSHLWRSEVLSENAASRIWGQLTAFGDPEFLLELEEELQITQHP